MLIKSSDSNSISNGEESGSESKESLAPFACWIFYDRKNESLHSLYKDLIDQLGVEHIQVFNVSLPWWLASFYNRFPDGPYPDLVIGLGSAGSRVASKVKRRCSSVFSVQFKTLSISSGRNDLVFRKVQKNNQEGWQLLNPDEVNATMSIEQISKVIVRRFFKRQKLFKDWSANLGSPSVEL